MNHSAEYGVTTGHEPEALLAVLQDRGGGGCRACGGVGRVMKAESHSVLRGQNEGHGAVQNGGDV